MINDKVIWITGASSGIGKALVNHLGQNNKIILSSRRPELLKDVAHKAGIPEKEYAVVRLDQENTSSINVAYEQGLKAFGHVDIVILNAGISQRGSVSETELDVIRRVMEINFFGTIHLAKLLLKHFQERRKGHFCVISSISGLVGSKNRAGYSASKHALEGYFECLKTELYEQWPEINITMINPGFVRTSVTKNALDPHGEKQGYMEKNTKEGLSPEKAAEKIALAIEKKKQRAVFGGKEKYGYYLKRFFPGLIVPVVARVQV